MVRIRFAEGSLPTGETRIHDVFVDPDKAGALLMALGMRCDTVRGEWFLPLGQRNPGRIETAFIYEREG